MKGRQVKSVDQKRIAIPILVPFNYLQPAHLKDKFPSFHHLFQFLFKLLPPIFKI